MPRKEDLRDVMPALGMTEGFDVGLEMSGAAPAFRDMIDTMNNGGKIAILGIAPTGFEIDWNKVIFKMLHLKGIYGREMFETWYKMIALVQGGLDVSPADHPPHRHRRFPDRLRCDAQRQFRQGGDGLVRADVGRSNLQALGENSFSRRCRGACRNRRAAIS